MFEAILRGVKRKKKDEIVIKDTTKDAFVTMIDFCYGKEVEWVARSIEELFDIANMAEKYQLEVLMKEVEEAFKKFPLDEENFVTVASVAENYSQFEGLTNTIHQKCSLFLSSILKERNDCFEFAVKYSGTKQSEIAFKLLAGIKNFKLRCCDLKTCRRGKPILEKKSF